MTRFWKLFVGLGTVLLAKHIAGAELYYTCIDPQNYRYRFELWLYRDCTDPTGADYDNPIRVYVFEGNGEAYADFSVSLTAAGPWQPTGVEACFLQTPQTCLEEGVYRFEYTLPPNPSGYYVAWARCCRNATITNLQNPLYEGVTYLAYIPPARRAGCNSAPRFSTRPPFFLCAGRDFFFDQHASDPDGDSLVYAISAAYHSQNTAGAGAVHTSLGSPTVGPHNPMGPPPYQTVVYAAGYSAQQPFGPGGICQIDPQTGLLHVNAPNPGLYVVVISVFEYRQGQLLSEVRRDMQFYVSPCRPPSPPPAVSHNLLGLTVQGDTILIPPQQAYCYQAIIQDTAPPPDGAQLSYQLIAPSGGTSVQVLSQNPLTLQICRQESCNDTGRVLPLIVIGQKTERCGTTFGRDTIYVKILPLPPRTLTQTLQPLNLPLVQGAYELPVDSVACTTFWVAAAPALPQPQVNVYAPTGANVSYQTFWRNDTLFGELCYRAGCEAVNAPISIVLEGVATRLCPPYPIRRDTLWFRARLPDNPPPLVRFLAPDSLFWRPESLYCLRVGIVDSPPVSRHTLYLQAVPPIIQVVSVVPDTGQLTWEAQVCLRPICDSLNQWVQLIAEVRDSLQCAELQRRYDTLLVFIQSHPTYPVAIYAPTWPLTSPYEALYKYPYCVPITVTDTARNGGPLNISVSSPLSVQLAPSSGAGPILQGRLCFAVRCDLSPDSVYPIILTATNTPPCANTPPATQETLWVRPRPLSPNRPPIISRDLPSPWQAEITPDSLCYTLTITDPDTFSLLATQYVGASFSPEFFYGANFHPTVIEQDPLRIRLCAALNCHAQAQTYPTIVCITDTTSCDTTEHWQVCDTFWVETPYCHGVMPNVFTPNGDGINDVLRPYNLSGVAQWQLSVWDRWGRPLFAGSWNEGWNGLTPEGHPAQEGVYFYLLRLELLSGNGPLGYLERVGHATLLR
jgi:gliding motility-associated-like protein